MKHEDHGPDFMFHQPIQTMTIKRHAFGGICFWCEWGLLGIKQLDRLTNLSWRKTELEQREDPIKGLQVGNLNHIRHRRINRMLGFRWTAHKLSPPTKVRKTRRNVGHNRPVELDRRLDRRVGVVNQVRRDGREGKILIFRRF